MKIIQIIKGDKLFYQSTCSRSGEFIYGLGEDNKMYFWDYDTNEWQALTMKSVNGIK